MININGMYYILLISNELLYAFAPLQLLPSIFINNDTNKKFVQSEQAKLLVNQMNKLMMIHDDKFEQFHRVVNRIDKDKFPLKFDNVHCDNFQKHQMEQFPQVFCSISLSYLQITI